MIVYRFWCRFLAFFDMVDDRGKPVFSKMAVATILVAVVIAGDMTLGKIIAIISGAMGRSMWMAFLNRSKVDVSESIVHEYKTITERRDPSLGIEPTP